MRKINQVLDFIFIRDLFKDRYIPDFSGPADDPERLCLLQYLYGD